MREWRIGLLKMQSFRDAENLARAADAGDIGDLNARAPDFDSADWWRFGDRGCFQEDPWNSLVKSLCNFKGLL